MGAGAYKITLGNCSRFYTTCCCGTEGEKYMMKKEHTDDIIGYAC